MFEQSGLPSVDLNVKILRCPPAPQGLLLDRHSSAYSYDPWAGLVEGAGLAELRFARVRVAGRTKLLVAGAPSRESFGKK